MSVSPRKAKMAYREHTVLHNLLDVHLSQANRQNTSGAPHISIFYPKGGKIS
jgi:hypothetical protein